MTEAGYAYAFVVRELQKMNYSKLWGRENLSLIPKYRRHPRRVRLIEQSLPPQAQFL
ncbi:hypothetical protein NIES22_08950 [Calothrix brevissima NIES-22]|nr:hypothetical protein NIES22_08950 [Calothrix brevissima NIES-22]